MKTNWRSEIARDFVAVGSWPFYALIVARSAIQPYRPFLDQMIIAGVFFAVLTWYFKSVDTHAGLAIIEAIFTGLFYFSIVFTIFAVLVVVLLIVASIFLKTPVRNIFLGTAAGLVVSGIAYFLAQFTMQ